VNARAWQKLETLAAKCAAALRDPARQSEHVWRGEMWAIIGAHHEIKKARSARKSDARGMQTPSKTANVGQSKASGDAE
jgi:hypothetical protein